jgi:hypothetical protein
MKKICIALLLSCCALTGCTSLSLDASHTSHPFAGPPFGPASEEDSLNSISACLQREARGWYAEQCLGYKIGDGGFYGPRLIYTARAGMKWRLNH